MKKRTLILEQVVAVVVLLTACGGGKSDSSDWSTSTSSTNLLDQVPLSASQSTGGMVTYLATLAAQISENKQPVEMSNFNPPSPEDTEPEPLS